MLKNFVLIVIFFLIVGYAYITVSERQQQRLIRERRPKIQQMFDKYEFRRALYQIRDARDRAKDTPQQAQPSPNEENTTRPRPDEPLRNDMEYLERLKSERSTPAQPIEQNLYDPKRLTRGRTDLPAQRDTGDAQDQGQYQQQNQVQYPQQQDQGQYQDPAQEQIDAQRLLQLQRQQMMGQQPTDQPLQPMDPQQQPQQPTDQPLPETGGRYPQAIGN